MLQIQSAVLGCLLLVYAYTNRCYVPLSSKSLLCQQLFFLPLDFCIDFRAAGGLVAVPLRRLKRVCDGVRALLALLLQFFNGLLPRADVQVPIISATGRVGQPRRGWGSGNQDDAYLGSWMSCALRCPSSISAFLCATSRCSSLVLGLAKDTGD